jgi:glucosamine--fructose-6-phosphate aminotransferase (isomerizing)
LCAGVEHSVAATKSMIAGLVAGASLVAAWREDRQLADALSGLPDVLRGQTATPPAAMLEQLANARSAFVLGRGATLAIAAEAALKLKETCAIHAEAYSAAEVLHGPAELVDSGFPVIAFLPSDAARKGMLPTLAALADAGATVITIEAGGTDDAHRLATAKVEATLLEPIVMIHRFYRLAEALAIRLGRDPDRPRNLRKVTETL